MTATDGDRQATDDRPSTRARLRAKLSSPEALRDAILLHEVLGPPVSLREPA